MTKIESVSSEIMNEINALKQNGLELLGIAPATEPHAIVAAITEYIRACRDTHSDLTEQQLYALGALLGCQYVQGLNWHWGSVVWDYDEENGAIGVLSPDNSLFTNPIGWVSEVVEGRSGVPFMLSYNMIADNQTPVFDPGSATSLY